MIQQIDRIPSSPPSIIPISKNKFNRPLWSIMIPVYNCSEYLTEVLLSVLVQDMGEDKMQIEVIDDASTDADLESIINVIGKGRIKYFRQKNNVGNLRNFETCINRAKGKFVHILHGDDRVCLGFYNKITFLFNKYPKAGAAFCNYNFIDKNGLFLKQFSLEEKVSCLLNDWLVRIAKKQKIQFASIVVKREVYEHLGSFYGMSYGEDWEMWVRIAKHYPVAFTPEVLAEYRTHSNSLTSKNALEGNTYFDMCKAINIIQSHLPHMQRENILNINKIKCAHDLIGSARNVWNDTNNFKLTQSILIQSLKMHTDYCVIARIIKLLTHISLNKLIKIKNEPKPLDTYHQTENSLV